MPQNKIKGIKDLYEECCDGSFYDWVLPSQNYTPPPLASRHLCWAPIWYNDSEGLSLHEDKYDPLDEFNSTWKLAFFSMGTRSKRLPHQPYKQFQLESEDDLLVVKCKIRPVLLIKKISSDWRVPGNSTKLFHTWLCLPLFSYKQRHTQEYVLIDQALRRSGQFYFPPGNPGLDEESAAKFIEIQFIPEINLTPLKKMCETLVPIMNRPICITDKAFMAVIGHLVNFLPAIEVTGDAKEWYEFFAEFVREEVDKVVE